jgi:hypothetical protein
VFATQTWKVLSLRLRRYRAERRRRINPWRDWAASGVVLAIGLVLGLSSLPNRPTLSPAAATLSDPRGQVRTVAPAVFALRDSGAAVRFANAEVTRDGEIRVGFYDPLDPLLATATEPVSLPGDARLLWLLAAPAERQAIRQRAAALVVAVSTGSREILGSAEFTEHYRDRFAAIFQNAAREAWHVTQERGAWRALIRGLEPTLRDLIQRDIRPVVERHFRGIAGRMLRANALVWLDPFTDRPWDTAPIEDALREAVQELRDRDVPERIIARLIDSPQAGTFLRLYQDELVRVLAHDDQLQSLLAEMAFDERFRRYADTMIERANELSRYAPRLLVSLRGGEELNLVAATVIRATIAGRGDRVVVFMSPAQRDELSALDQKAVQPLDRKGRT